MAAPSIVFIGGCERSGTTLLARELARHSTAIALPESMFLAESLPARGQELARRISAHWRLATWPVPRSQLRARLSAVAGDEPPIQVLRRLVDAIDTVAGADDGSFRTIVDSSPWNLRLADRLRAAFPDARFVHVVRDGRGVYSSVRGLEWGPSTPIRGAQWWMASVAVGLAAEHALDAPRVRYEDLVADPSAAVGSLCRQLDLPLYVAGHDGGPQPGAYTAGQHRLLTMPVDRSRSEAWRGELPAREAALFEAEAAAVLRALDYPASDVTPPGLARHMAEDVRRAIHVVGRDGPRRLRRRAALAARAGRA